MNKKLQSGSKILLFLLPLIITLNSCKEKEVKILPGSTEIKINKNWKFRQAGKDDWRNAEVPGNVHTDLLKNKIISDPFKNDGERKLQWIEREDWEYKTNFYIPFSTLNYDRVEINLDGLDTYANVYLNDSLILKADNMFIGWKIPCKQFLRPGENVLKIYFHSPINKSLPIADSLKYHLPAPFDVAKLKSSIFTRKAAFQYGWDFSPRFITYGIWRPVRINAWNTARINNVKIIQQQIKNLKADLSAVLEIESEIDIKAEINIKSKEKLFGNFKKNINLKKGKNICQIDFQIKKPKRWWANGLGEAFLYNIITQLKINSQLADSATVRTGLRTIEIENKKDSTGESFTILLNDKPVYIKGASYVPPDVFIPRVSKEKYKNIILSAKKANINMLRVIGSGIYENNEFYDLCDENGILVWQDFMFSNAMYPTFTLFNNSIEHEVDYNVKRLRNHPSIALWCGNENIENSWYNLNLQKGYNYSTADSSSIWENYLKIFHVIIRNSLKDNDDRYYLPSSPKFPFPKNINAGNYNFTEDWKDVKNANDFNKNSGRFVNGFGFQSLPYAKTLLSFAAPQDFYLDGPVFKSHQKLNDGNKILKDYILQFYKSPKNFESLIYVSQLMQAGLLKKAIESQRRKKPYCMGSIYNYLNDCWPGINSSTIDYEGNWKAAHFIIKKAFAPILVSPVEEGDKLKIYIVSDRLVNVSGVLEVKIMDFNGKIIFTQQIPVQVAQNSNKVYFESSEWKKYMKGRNMKNIVLEAKLSENDQTFYRNLYYFTLTKELALPTKAKIDLLLNGKEGNFDLTIITAKFQKNIFISSALNNIKLSDNFFDILPMEKITINIKCDKQIDKAELLKSLSFKSLIDTFK